MSADRDAERLVPSGSQTKIPGAVQLRVDRFNGEQLLALRGGQAEDLAAIHDDLLDDLGD